jgi:tRNA threonylcarbamoyladenosine biosynthesis protein TsaB
MLNQSAGGFLMLLALETATDQCSVVLYDALGVQAERLDTHAREQTRLILPMIDALLTERHITFSDLSAIAFSRGPGSFSGVRINAAVTQAIAWAHDLPVIAVSTLHALAQHAYRKNGLQQVCAVIDARMAEVYAASFQLDQHGVMQMIGNEQLSAYTAVNIAQGTQALVGSGSELVLLDAATDLARDVTCIATAHDIAFLGWNALQQGKTLSAKEALPVYLRDDAWKKLDQQRKIAL